MIKAIVGQWDAKKTVLEAWFKENHPMGYGVIVKKLFELVITEGYDVSKMTVIDNGEYQGTTIYIIPEDIYQPSVGDYIMTDNYYGSCSGCDTLQAITSHSDEAPTEEQVKDYMGLALNLVQKMRSLC